QDQLMAGAGFPDERPLLDPFDACLHRPLPSSLAFPAPVRRLLPVYHGMACRFRRFPVAARRLDLRRVMPVEEEDGPLVARNIGRLRAVDQKAYLRTVRVGRIGGEQDGLFGRMGFPVRRMGEERIVAE